jgi:hypothetical protein
LIEIENEPPDEWQYVPVPATLFANRLVEANGDVRNGA